MPGASAADSSLNGAGAAGSSQGGAAAVTEAGAALPTFTEVAESAGILGGPGSWGAAWADFDGDGDLDVYTIGHLQEVLGGDNQLWGNRGNGRFVDVSAATGLVSEKVDTHSALWADLDNDADPDLLLLNEPISGHQDIYNELWRNDGGTFTEVCEVAGLQKTDYLTRGAAAADFDRDGLLDLFVTVMVARRPPAAPPYHGENLLFHNRGDWTFEEVAAGAGVAYAQAKKRSASWGDINDDGWPDLIISPPCALFQNQGDGTFTNVTETARIQENIQCQATAWNDYDHDGDLDLYASRGFDVEVNDVLYRNEGNGRFANANELAGISNPHLSRAATWGDVDNDGDDDLYVVNFDNPDVPNVLYLNQGDGTFTDVAEEVGVGGQVRGGGSDASFVDYDGDGDLDLFVTNGEGETKGPYVLYRNGGNSNHWLQIQLIGTESNRDALGARVAVESGLGTRHYLHSGPSHFVTQSLTPLHVGLGTETSVDAVTVAWPSGAVERFEVADVDRKVTLTEGTGNQDAGEPDPTFEDVTEDAGIEGLNASWGKSWGDYNGDGDLDLLTHGHLQDVTGSLTQLWRNNGNRTFTDVTLEAGIPYESGDTHGSVFGDFDGDGCEDLYLVNGSQKSDPLHWNRFYQNNCDGTFTSVGEDAGVIGSGHRGRGAYAFDFDRDGWLDLFSTSYDRGPSDFGNLLFHNNGDLTFTDLAAGSALARDDAENRAAAWADYDSDGLDDILLVGPIALLKNLGEDGFRDVTESAGLTPAEGASAATWGDIDGDGDFDLFVSMGFDSKIEDTLYRNEGDGTFSDVSESSGLSNVAKTRGASFGDYDNDGDLDLYVVNLTHAAAPNRLYQNAGDGTFADVAEQSGATGNVTGAGADGSFVDYDNDGFLDLFVTNGEGNSEGEYLLLRNHGNRNNWLKVRLLGGDPGNSDGIGAKARVRAGSLTLYGYHGGPTHFLSQSQQPLHFGLGSQEVADELTITWPSGATTRLEGVTANQQIEVRE